MGQERLGSTGKGRPELAHDLTAGLAGPSLNAVTSSSPAAYQNGRRGLARRRPTLPIG